jgi:hypothetical protein
MAMGRTIRAIFRGCWAQLNRADAPGDLGLVQGRRDKRVDSGWKKFGSRFANNVRRSMLKDSNTDSGCGMRAFKRDAYLQIPYFDHMHRYLPALMQSEGFMVEERAVGHRGAPARTVQLYELRPAGRCALGHAGRDVAAQAAAFAGRNRRNLG